MIVGAAVVLLCAVLGASAKPIPMNTRFVPEAATPPLKTMRLHREVGVRAPAPHLYSFDYEISLRGVQYSAAAYCSNSTVKDWSCKPCHGAGLPALSDINVFYAKKTSTYGYVGLDSVNKYIVVAFQGTHNLKQWIDDLKFMKTDLHYPGAGSDVKVHRGFYEAYQEVKGTVDRFVESTFRQNPNYRILVTGHSLGAALAAMCSLDLSIQFPSASIYHYTFGQPRVGNAPFYDFFKQSSIKASFRFVHNRDIVPHLPLEAMGFHHIATEVFYKEQFSGPESLHECNGSGEDPDCSDQFNVDISISDHLNYLGFTVDTDACH
ncbi:hypothetical protein PTSG_04353 [Salpingoeca rosetta]|uniref:Fungal lipase-type domain-containing protein n=1 Tax=Salpingoeca rosetta (strain ATCC 50818 / BSB-021) TaxID=946362 RepID=F2U8A9_SALR5|nr:uncharacterized protein PTSG_04353 [Salpingoeca rosetta]EGD72617.1 hypothetical protein PTSG_04353 [Salpingoeca rosetta]|eukprot:XP_004994440.1 hypothetical protein PTSG_04353 [Salpingoeca rosetta]